MESIDWHSLIGPAVVAAIVSGLVAVIGMVVSAWTARQLHTEKLEFDRQLAERKFEFDKELAQRKFDLDRSQLIHKRRFELAEALLADAYRFRDIMRYVRSGFSFEGEGQTRKSNREEPDSIKQLKNSYFAPVERLQKQSEFINNFTAKRPAALAHFGSEASRAFDLFQQAIVSVQTASEALIDMADEGNRDPDLTKRFKQDLWVGHSASRKQADEVAKNIEEGVLLYESFCKPVLQWEGA